MAIPVPARRSRNQQDPTTDEHGWTRIRENLSSSVLIRVHPWLKKSSRPATISGDTDRLQVCATGVDNALNTYPARTGGKIKARGISDCILRRDDAAGMIGDRSRLGCCSARPRAEYPRERCTKPSTGWRVPSGPRGRGPLRPRRARSPTQLHCAG